MLRQGSAHQRKCKGALGKTTVRRVPVLSQGSACATGGASISKTMSSESDCLAGRHLSTSMLIHSFLRPAQYVHDCWFPRMYNCLSPAGHPHRNPASWLHGDTMSKTLTMRGWPVHHNCIVPRGIIPVALSVVMPIWRPSAAPRDFGSAISDLWRAILSPFLRFHAKCEFATAFHRLWPMPLSEGTSLPLGPPVFIVHVR